MTPPNGQDDSVLKDELSDFGLSETEITTYLALLSRGEATVSTVAEDAGLTQRAVYNITERLEDRGLMRVNDHVTPTTIRVLPPERAMANLSDQLDSITPLLKERYNEPQRQTPEIEMVKSRKTALKRLKSAISQAEKEVILAIPEHIYSEVESELQAAVSDDVLVLLLIGDVEVGSVDETRFADSADVVHGWDESVPFLYTVDGRSAMIGSADIVSGTHNDEDAVEVSQTRLTGTVLGTYLGTYWPASTEVYVTDPYPLPKTFDWFRQTVLHAILHRREGTELWAEIETSSGEELSGEITQIRQAFVEPITNEFSLETSFYIKTEKGEVSIGGPETFIEDYKAKSITLRENP